MATQTIISKPTVVIPVYNAFEALRGCLESVAASVAGETPVIVIDDGSTDERVLPLITDTVRSGGPRWRLVRQPGNLGFVATANLGMRLTCTDVILLNSDTEVFPGWLERMAACLASDSRMATCTPWSNNAEIASIPRFCAPNPVPGDASGVAAALAEASRALGGPVYPEIPTAVGFCMGITRRAINAVGLFDAGHFGLGYGEENDFSCRVREAGFRNVLCDDVYVVHHGGKSFGPRGLKPDDDTMRRLLQLHPGYQAEILEYIQEDPLSPLREAISAAVIEAGVSFE